MQLLQLFRTDRSEVARLRDELIVARTGNVLLFDMLSRKYREPRKDKASIIKARKAMTARLKREMGRA